MPVSGLKISSSLVLRVKTGVDGSGNDILSTVTLRRVKTSAPDQDLYDTAQGISALLKNPVDSILRQDVNELINQ